MNTKTVTKGVVSEGRMPWVSGKNLRRLSLLRRAGLFDGTDGIAPISRAVKLGDLLEAYRLVYATYLESGYIQHNSWAMRIRPFEACAETATFIARATDRIVGVLSLILDSPDLGLPSDACYARELDALRSKGLKLCEGSNQAVLPAYRRTSVTMELVRCGIAQGLTQGCDGIIVTVNPQHYGFYDLLGFHKIGDVRSYSSAHNDPVVMMCLDTTRFRDEPDATLEPYQRYVSDFISSKNPFVNSVKQWHHEADECFRDPGLLRALFVSESDFLETCSDYEHLAIRLRWGEDLYAQVEDTVSAETTHAQGGYISDVGRKNGNSTQGKKPGREIRKNPKNLYGHPSILPITPNESQVP